MTDFDDFARRAGDAMRGAGNEVSPQGWELIARGHRRVRVAAWIGSVLAVVVIAAGGAIAFAPGAPTDEPIPPVAPSTAPPSTPAPTTRTPTSIPASTDAPPSTDTPASAGGRIEFVTNDGTAIATLIGGDLDVEGSWAAVVDVAIQELEAEPRYGLGATAEERLDRLRGCPELIADCSRDLVVSVTLESTPQAAAEAVLDIWLADALIDGVIVMVHNETGAVVAGADSSGSDRWWTYGRQAGGLMMPIAAVAALEAGYTLESLLPGSSPLTLEPDDGPSTWVCYNPGGDGGPDEVTLAQAIVLSVNTAFCQLGVDLDPELVATAAKRLGIEAPQTPVPSIGLGVNVVGFADVATAYASLSNHGVRHDDTVIRSVVRDDGVVLAGLLPGQGEVVDAAVADAVTDVLYEVVESGTGTRAQLVDRSVAGKTGTTQGYSDAWFVGSTSGYTAVVWVGAFDSQASMRDLEINGEFYRRVFGGSVPAPMWAEFMAKVLDGLPAAGGD